MFLAVTALEQARPKDCELLFLGPWCRRQGETGEVLPDPWASLESRRRAYAECLALHDRLLPALSKGLGLFHSLELSPRAWRLLLSPWLIRYIQIIMDRHERLRRAFKDHPGLRTVKIRAAGRRIPADTYDFTVLSFEDPYNLQLMSGLLEAMGLPADEIDFDVPPAADLSSRVHRREAAGPLFRAARGLAGLAVRARRWPLLLHGMPETAALTRDLAPSVWRLLTETFSPAAGPRPGKEALKTFVPATDFERILAAVLPAELPACFGSGLPALLDAAKAALPKPPRVLVSADGWTYDEFFKACAARSSDFGTRLVAVQHGGGYGQYGRIWQEVVEREVVDSYWTWGWSGLDGDSRLRSVPAPWLSFRIDDKTPGAGLILVGTYQPRWRYGFQSQAQAEQFGAYLDARNGFFTSLPEETRAASSVRLSPHDMGWDQAGRLHSAAPEVRQEFSAGPLHERLRGAALAVFDHPATSFLESMALDRPTLLFWNPTIWDERESAKPLLDGLRRARILHDRPESAAAEAVAALKDPRGWWARAEAREAAAAFRRHFCLTAPDWRLRWAESLRAELAAATAAE